jgi:branched-chain amino acid transport system ATP-binding protein
MDLLTVRKINSFYGMSHILFDLSITVHSSEIVSLLGRNGVGKSTTLKSIIGLVSPRSGNINLSGKEILGMSSYQIARLGIGYVPEDRIIFSDLTVLENLEMGTMSGLKGDWTLDLIFDLFPVLKLRHKQKGGTLSGGEQQMLTIGRSLMGNPILLLLDEPSEGLAPIVVQAIYKTIKRISGEGMSIFLCEQNSDFALKLSSRTYILEKGHICWDGPSTDLLVNRAVMSKYLGI